VTVQFAAEAVKMADTAKRVGDVAREFSDIEKFNATHEVTFLREKGLLFREEDRYLSLVLRNPS